MNLLMTIYDYMCVSFLEVSNDAVTKLPIGWRSLQLDATGHAHPHNVHVHVQYMCIEFDH